MVFPRTVARTVGQAILEHDADKSLLGEPFRKIVPSPSITRRVSPPGQMITHGKGSAACSGQVMVIVGWEIFPSNRSGWAGSFAALHDKFGVLWGSDVLGPRREMVRGRRSAKEKKKRRIDQSGECNKEEGWRRGIHLFSGVAVAAIPGDGQSQRSRVDRKSEDACYQSPRRFMQNRAANGRRVTF